VRSSVKQRLWKFPAAATRDGWRLGPWLRRAEHREKWHARRDLGSVVHTRESGDRGDLGGETGVLEEVQGTEDFSPEFVSGAARFRRGCARRSGGERRVKPCQGAVREQEGGGGVDRRPRGAGAYCRSTMISFTSGGAAGSGSGGLAAMG
jgi:hypothetical protein